MQITIGTIAMRVQFFEQAVERLEQMNSMDILCTERSGSRLRHTLDNGMARRKNKQKKIPKSKIKK